MPLWHYVSIFVEISLGSKEIQKQTNEKERGKK